MKQSKLTNTNFTFVPGHAGVTGNERADSLAGMVAVEIERAKDRADILNAIKEVEREKDASTDLGSETFYRLQERRG